MLEGVVQVGVDIDCTGSLNFAFVQKGNVICMRDMRKTYNFMFKQETIRGLSGIEN